MSAIGNRLFDLLVMSHNLANQWLRALAIVADDGRFNVVQIPANHFFCRTFGLEDDWLAVWFVLQSASHDGMAVAGVMPDFVRVADGNA